MGTEKRIALLEQEAEVARNLLEALTDRLHLMLLRIDGLERRLDKTGSKQGS